MIRLPNSIETDVIADWAELSCLFGDRNSLSRSKIEQAFEAAGIDDHENLASDMWQEIERRNEVAGECHPVKAFTGRIESSKIWTQAPVYSFQLLVASHSFFPRTRINRTRWNITAKIFERLATLALQIYLGGTAVNVGSPRKDRVPRGFKDCLDYICQQSKELRGRVASYNNMAKDENVDVIAWHPFPDNRPGQVIILAHCAAGVNWKDKASEVSLELWRDYIDWATRPLVAFAFPFVCIRDLEWRYLSRQTRGFLMDRLRISSILAPHAIPDSMGQTLIRWCQSQQRYLPHWDG
ncbi:MAG: hypothetical protein LUQ38_05460 [Methanotrichaceae archaeon]|nr:hypothetical protein [Methanotrichaceae archaeon]MDD1758218.1 hypothetical protein [Methanotrichaceae archaeon]